MCIVIRTPLISNLFQKYEQDKPYNIARILYMWGLKTNIKSTSICLNFLWKVEIEIDSGTAHDNS